jgi:hypothetical protein
VSEKLKAIDNLRPLMGHGAVLFGATILDRESERRGAKVARPLQYERRVQQSRGRSGRQGFDTVEIEREGCVALFCAA